MNAGLANLYTLKAHLLGAAMITETKFDTVITALGLGVAAQFEKFTNRKFMRETGATHDATADRTLIVLPHLPVESVASLSQKSSEADGFVDLGTVNSIVRAIDLKSGIIYLGARLGPAQDLVRVTYTGGWFWNQLEPDDEGYPTALPAGATALPDDLKLAWLLQCQEIWSQRDKLGLAVTDAPDTQSKLAGLKLIPAAVEMLNPYRRFG